MCILPAATLDTTSEKSVINEYNGIYAFPIGMGINDFM